ncbi:MAG: hypothetical protein NVSMB31_20590 [Vulcanimicrobiaceae bacterium]
MATLRILASAFALALACSLPAAAAKHHLLDYGPAIKKMAGIRVPIILPMHMPEGDEDFYVGIIDIAWDDYMLGVWTLPDCHEATVCRFAHMFGSRPTEERLTGKRIYLKQFGVTAYFTLGPCGFGCSDSTLAFEINGWRYVYGIKGSSEQYMVRAAKELRFVKTPTFRAR